MEFQVRDAATFAYTGARPFDPALTSVLFIHGAGLDHTVWIQQSRWFAHHGFNAIAVDLPGHGRSAGPVLASIEAMAAWVTDCINALSLEQVCVVGHSMGALVTLQTAADDPRVQFAGLLGLAVPMPVTDALLDAARDQPADAHRMITGWGHGFSAQLGGNPAPGMWMTGGATRLLERGAPGVLANDLGACNAYQGGLDAAARVSCPALVLLGAQDIMASPRGATAAIEALSRGQRVVLADCGHMMMAEQPDAVLDALRDAVAASSKAA